MHLLQRLRALVPTREYIRTHRGLSWLGPRLSHARLWRWSRRGVALGVALGVFFGLLVPIAQIPLSVTAAMLLRANIPAAAASTLITNPVTFAPIYYAAYHLGAWISGAPIPAQPAGTESAVAKPLDVDASYWERISSLGKPLLIGLLIMATLMGLLSYGLINLIWHWRTAAKRRSRKQP